jgi:hypothetical protein
MTTNIPEGAIMTRLLLLVPILLFAGCVQSLHPFYTEEQLTFEPNLVGYWSDADGKNTLDIPELNADPDSKAYRVSYTDEHGKTGAFIARLARVDKHLIADITPEELDEARGGMYKAQFLPVHSCLLVEVTRDSLKVRSMDYNWLRKELEARPASISHENLDGDRILLTAPPEKVQAFVLKHVDTPGAFGDWSEYKRTTPKPATRPAH